MPRNGSVRSAREYSSIVILLRATHVKSPIAVLCTLMYLACSLGVLPGPRLAARLLAVADPQRYPCEACGCGCASARECWTQCCCHSEHERLVWALSSGVEPPAYVHFTDEQWLAAARQIDPDKAGCNRCVAEIRRDLARGICLARPGHDARPSTCAAGCAATPAESSAACQSPPKPLAQSRSLHRGAMSALSCRGLSPLLTFSPPPVFTESLRGILPRPPVVAMLPAEHLRAESRTLETTPPPPRSAPTLRRA